MQHLKLTQRRFILNKQRLVRSVLVIAAKSKTLLLSLQRRNFIEFLLVGLLLKIKDNNNKNLISSKAYSLL